jgi:hypothetical protein
MALCTMIYTAEDWISKVDPDLLKVWLHQHGLSRQGNDKMLAYVEKEAGMKGGLQTTKYTLRHLVDV